MLRHAIDRFKLPRIKGWCSICQAETVFIELNPWLRDNFRCRRCQSIPRQRALIHVLETRFPNWRSLRVHESSPCAQSSLKIAGECKNYVPSQFFQDLPLGSMKGPVRCENLERQTFPDASFDLVVTGDVFEHVLHPADGFREIARTLKPGGAHVFTIPWFWWKETLVRARQRPDGTIEHLEAPDYHGNAIDDSGSLVITEWGKDFCDFIYKSSCMTTTALLIKDRKLGLDGDFLEVFISVNSHSRSCG